MNREKGFDVFVGATTSAIKGVKIGRNKENRIKNLQNLASITRDDRVTRIAWGDDEREVLIACGNNDNKSVKIHDAESIVLPNSFLRNTGTGSINGISRYNGLAYCAGSRNCDEKGSRAIRKRPRLSSKKSNCVLVPSSVSSEFHRFFDKYKSEYSGKMQYSRVAALLLPLFAAVVNGSQYVEYVQSRVLASGGCDSYTCGTNARCTMSEGRPVCSCLNLHMGDPLARCVRVECLINDDCPYNRVCTNNRCVDPCVGLCGVNANCLTRNHIGTCECIPGHVGDPFSRCQVADPQAACKPSPCGVNTQCEVINEVPVCTCVPGYRGSPLTGCRHECESDSECPLHLACSQSYRCESPCKCGENAECQVINHQAKCSCPKTWNGNPFIACRPECTAHAECPPNKPACLYQKCVNPCDGVCGVNADCNLRVITPVCSCPKHMTGNPFVSCRLFEPRDLCEPNPCGVNAICTPGHDSTGKERPVCTCPTGYIGNALTSCQRGECFTDSECPDNRACIDFTCTNPCTGRECGPSATCTPRRHIAVCTCPQGTRGDALYTCNPIESKSVYNYGRAYRYRY